MSYTLLYFVVVGAFAALAYVMNRRLSALTFGLAVGLLLAPAWQGTLGGILGRVFSDGWPLFAIAGLIIVLGPSLVMLLLGPRASKMTGLLSAIVYAVMMGVVVAEPLARIVPVEAERVDTYVFVLMWRDPIVMLGLILGLLDVLANKSGAPAKGQSKH